MPRKRMSKTRMKMIIEDLKAELRPYLKKDLVAVDEGIEEVLKKHFDIVDLDPSELTTEGMGEDFAL